MRIVIAGASGFLGSRLARALTVHGDEVIRLVRRQPRAADERGWDPAAGRLDPKALKGADAVVNLAGATVARRWTSRYRQVIRTSRVDTTATLARTLAAGGERFADGLPRVLLNASAIGFYGDTGDLAVDESAAAGSGFLAEVCQDWEAAARSAHGSGARVVHLRTGLPLSPAGGLLKPLLPAFRLGVGGRLGSGGQYWPWIALEDWLAAVRWLLAHDDVSGPVNLVGPVPATNAEFTSALGRVLRRPTPLPVPAAALRAALGGFASEALDSHRVLPAVLTSAGFEFRHGDVASALRAALPGG